MLFGAVNSITRWRRTSAPIRLPGMAAKQRKPLAQWQVEDAQRLRTLFEKSSLSQGAFAAANEWTQGNVWQYLHGKIPLNVAAAIRFAAALGCRVADFSPRLEAERERLAAAGGVLTVPENLSPHVAQDVLAYTAQLSPAQQKELVKNLKDAAHANELVKGTLKVPELRHPEDTHVAKAYKPASRLKVDSTEDDERERFVRRQLPLFGKRKP